MEKEINRLKFVISCSFFKDKEQEAIEFFDSFFKYSGKKNNTKIFYKDIILVRYNKEQKIGKYKGVTFYIRIYDNKGNNVVIYQYQQSFDETFSKILHVVDRIIRPYLAVNLLKQLEIDGKIKIGSLVLTAKGLYKKRILRKAKFLPWRDYVRSEYKTPTAFQKKWRNFSEKTWMVGYRYTPSIIIYENHPQKKGYLRWFCFIDTRENNTIALPALLFALKSKYKN